MIGNFECAIVSYATRAEVVELADTRCSGRRRPSACVGSNPTFGTNPDNDGPYTWAVEARAILSVRMAELADAYV